MADSYDVLIVGAGTAGTYFGWQMAKRGHSVAIVDRDQREKVGKRLDIFHIDSNKFAEFELPVPEPDSPDFCLVLEKSTSYSPEGRYPKVVRYPFHVMRLPLYLQRLFGLAEAGGSAFSVCHRIHRVDLRKRQDQRSEGQARRGCP